MYIIGLVIVALAGSAGKSYGQDNGVQVTFHILPPYSPYFADYSGANAQRVLISLYYAGQQPLPYKLQVHIRGDNGFSARTRPGYVPAQPLLLQSNVLTQLTGAALAEVMRPEHIDITGADRNRIVRSQRLPEGNYEICLRVLSPEGQPLSEEVCSYVEISYPEPPVLLSPMDHDTLYRTGPQVINFAWMLPGNIPPAGTAYHLQIAEMPHDGANPNHVLDATSLPLVSYTSGLSTYLLTPADQPLVPGKAYAWRVRADAAGNDLQTLFKNNGYSQAQVFYYEDAAARQADPERAPSAGVTRKPETPVTRPATDTLLLEATVLYSYEGRTQRYPYTGAVYLHRVGPGGEPDPVPMAAATATDGKLTMPVPVGHDSTAAYRLRLNNPYFADPEQPEIRFVSGRLRLGEVTALVKAYSLQVEVTKGYLRPQEAGRSVTRAAAGRRVSLYRKAKDPLIPLVEGGREVRPGGGQWLLVATDTTRMIIDSRQGDRAVAVFDELPWNQPGEDEYIIHVAGGTGSGDTLLTGERFRFHPVAYTDQAENHHLRSGSAYTYQVTYLVHQATDEPPVATVKGRLLYQWKDGRDGAHPLGNTRIRLEPFYVFEDASGKMVVHPDNDLMIVPVDAANKPTAHYQDADKFGNRPSVHRQPAAITVTKPDGSFEFSDFALYDSVFVYDGFFNVSTERMPVPEQHHVATEVLERIPGWGLRVQDVAGFINPAVNGRKVVSSALQRQQVLQQFSQQLNQSGTIVPEVVGGGAGQRGGPQAPFMQSLRTDPVQSPVKYGSPMKLRRSMRVVVDDDRFCSPDNNMDINPFEVLDAGTLHSMVNSYQLRVRVHEKDIPAASNLAGVHLLLRRAPKEQAALQGEENADMFSQQDPGRTIFKRLVNNRIYQLTAKTNDTVNTNNAYQDGAPVSVHHTTYEGAPQKIVFNSQFTEKTVEAVVGLLPKHPVIAGRVQNSRGKAPIKGATVILKGGGQYYGAITDETGYFVFSNLPVQVPFTLYCGQPGYHPAHAGNGQGGHYEEEIPGLTRGRKVFKEIFFTPSALITGTVLNAQGGEVPSLVKVDETGNITSTVCIGKANAGPIELFRPGCQGGGVQVYAPGGRQVRVVITPHDRSYFADTLLVTTPPSGTVSLGDVIVKERRHRMHFRVRGRAGDGTFSRVAGLEGTRIELLDTVLVTTADKRSGQPVATSSSVHYEFANITQRNFWVKVIPPSGSGYVTREMVISNTESKTDRQHEIELEPGDAVWGTVRAGGRGIRGAVVIVSQGDAFPVLEAVTDDQGAYRVEGIRPVEGAVRIRTSVPPQASHPVFYPGRTRLSPVNRAVDFDLEPYQDLDVSALLGFVIRVTDLKQENDKTYIDGELLLPDEYARFAPGDALRRLTFSRVAVRANSAGEKNAEGLPFAEPEHDVVLDQATHRMRFSSVYNVLLESSDKSGPAAGNLLLKKTGPRSGYLQTAARIVDNSFHFPGSHLSFADSDNQFYFARSDKKSYSNTLHLFGEERPSRWHFSAAGTANLTFRYLGFKTDSRVAETYFDDDKIRIKPVIYAQVATLRNDKLEIAMPPVTFSSRQVDAVQGNTPLSVGLEEWQVTVGTWRAGTAEGGIIGTGNNQIRTDAGISIPFSTFRLTHVDGRDELVIEGARPAGLKLGGFHPVSIAKDVQMVFGLDTRTGNDLGKHYVLRMLGGGGNAAATVDGLPGFATPIELQSVSLVSNGQQYISFSPNTPVTDVHQVVHFKPMTLADSEGGFTVLGNMDFGIPGMASQYGGFRFSKGKGAEPAVGLDVHELVMEMRGNVRFESDRNPSAPNGRKLLEKGRLEIHGTVTEPGKLDKIPVRLLKLARSGGYDMDIRLRDEIYPMRIDQGMVMNLSRAWTTVNNGEWDYLRFTGTMDKGFAAGGYGNKPMTFAVHGDIKLDNGEIQVQHISTPLGKMDLVFDWAAREMRGSLAIGRSDGTAVPLADGISAKGMAELLLSKEGFYVAAGVQATVHALPPPFQQFAAGMVLGYHDRVPQPVFEKATRHMYHPRYPCGATGVGFKGFMIAARKDMISGVDFSLDIPPGLPAVSADVNIEAGADVTLYGNFSKGTHVELTPSVYGDVHLALGSGILCTTLRGSAKLSMMANFKYAAGSFAGSAQGILDIDTYYRMQIQTGIAGCQGEIPPSFDGRINLGAAMGFEGKKPYFRLNMNPDRIAGICMD